MAYQNEDDIMSYQLQLALLIKFYSTITDCVVYLTEAEDIIAGKELPRCLTVHFSEQAFEVRGKIISQELMPKCREYITGLGYTID